MSSLKLMQGRRSLKVDSGLESSVFHHLYAQLKLEWDEQHPDQSDEAIEGITRCVRSAEQERHG
jgi:hypothetical protein